MSDLRDDLLDVLLRGYFWGTKGELTIHLVDTDDVFIPAHGVVRFPLGKKAWQVVHGEASNIKDIPFQEVVTPSRIGGAILVGPLGFKPFIGLPEVIECDASEVFPHTVRFPSGELAVLGETLFEWFTEKVAEEDLTEAYVEALLTNE